MYHSILTLVFCLFSFYLCAQETFPQNGPRNPNHTTYVFKNVTLIPEPGQKLTNAVIVVKEGKIISAGVGLVIPQEAIVIDLKGKWLYASFIDGYTNYGMPELPKRQRGEGTENKQKKGAYAWNAALKPEVNAADIFTADAKMAEELRKQGFGTVLSFNRDGIARGTSLITTLNDDKEQKTILKVKAAQHFSFDKGSSANDYPSSLMGSIALLRQTYLDAQWYKNNKRELNLSLEAWNNNASLPSVFESNNIWNTLRADKLGDEFKISYLIKSGGDEYKRIAEVKRTGATFIVPLNFPAAPDVSDPALARYVNLSDLKEWELAPYNLALLSKNAIPFCITSYDLKDRKEFLPNLRKAVENGLSEAEALKALTVNPARLLGIEELVGSVKPGRWANFIITSGNIFNKETIIYENWVQGKVYKLEPLNPLDFRGTYELAVNNRKLEMQITGEADKPKLKLKQDTLVLEAKLTNQGNLVTISYTNKNSGLFRLTGSVDTAQHRLTGYGESPDGKSFNWTATLTKVYTEEAKKADTGKPAEVVIPAVNYPLGGYGFKELPKQGAILIKNATVWTNEKEGILTNTDVLIENGKIKAIGKDLSAPEWAVVIDGTGKHLTAGVIDEHSHIALTGGVNEGTQENTAEVRIGDIIDPEDVNIYRQLAGGVTGAQLLHGSANPIGGQSALIKLRWGRNAEEMKVENADGFIKFALGENVKQSNWGGGSRYPKTRMGVEQVYMDAFSRALEYEKRLKQFPQETRRDLELEALVEILNKKRFITCHSYVQSEINMLMHVADSFGFKVNTFTHILEGYKVADKMKRHGANASTFSDWWTYKFEVNEAIPYNAALLNQMGINTSMNSDDAEMARRLNQEAAKAVKYGNASEEEALKMVTLNPAKMLHLDNRTGSIKVGKDADLVLWTDHPLSVYAKPDKTLVDGIIYFDASQDALLRAEIKTERARLIQKALNAKDKGEKTEAPKGKRPSLYECETIEEYGY